MTVQENYKDWFWSHLDTDGLTQIPDALLAQDNFTLKPPGDQSSDKASNLAQSGDYLEEIQQAASLARTREQEKYLEVVRVAASMYVLQGDMRGAEICNTLENLLKSA